MPNSKIDATFPLQTTNPSSGTNIFAINDNKVLFPEPFLPTIPKTSPFFISNDMSSITMFFDRLTLFLYNFFLASTVTISTEKDLVTFFNIIALFSSITVSPQTLSLDD